MRNAAIMAIGIVCFLAGIGVGAGVAWMIAGRNTVGLAEVEQVLIEQTAYAEGWNDGYEARRKEESSTSGSQELPSNSGNASDNGPDAAPTDDK